MREYISVTETAKIIRSELKRNFPGVKFSVRSDKYSGGASIHIGWTDGPTQKAVESIAKKFQGAHFDGMQDLKESVDGEWEGKTVHFGSDYVFCSRHFSEKKERDAAEKVIAYWGLKTSVQELVQAFHRGDTYKIAQQHDPRADFHFLNRSMCDFLEERIEESVEIEPQETQKEENEQPQLAQTFVNGFKVRERIIHNEQEYQENMEKAVATYGDEARTVCSPITEEHGKSEPDSITQERAETYHTTPDVIDTTVTAFYDAEQATDAGQRLTEAFPTGCTLAEAIEVFKPTPALKSWGVWTRNAAGTTIYGLSQQYTTREEAFEAAKQGFAWFALEPDIEKIVEGGQEPESNTLPPDMFFQVGDMVRGHNITPVNNWHNEQPRKETEVLVVTALNRGMMSAKNGAGDLYQGSCDEFTPLFRNLIKFRYNDVDIQRANACHNGTSWTPERRGYLYADGYASTMSRLDERFSKFVTDANREELVAALESYRTKYLDLMWCYLHSYRNVISSAVTGPSNFPARRAEKRSQWADNHLNEWIEWQKQAESRLERQFNPKVIANAPISSDDDNAIDKLQEKLRILKKRYETMKAGNEIARNKKLSDEEKKRQLTELLNIPEAKIAILLSPRYSYERPGFQGWELSNILANIHRVEGRIAELEKKAQDVNSETQVGDVTIIEDVENNRVKVMFPERLSKEMHKTMRHAGFVYSRTNIAYQRKRSPQASRAAKECAEKYNKL